MYEHSTRAVLEQGKSARTNELAPYSKQATRDTISVQFISFPPTLHIAVFFLFSKTIASKMHGTSTTIQLRHIRNKNHFAWIRHTLYQLSLLEQQRKRLLRRTVLACILNAFYMATTMKRLRS